MATKGQSERLKGGSRKLKRAGKLAAYSTATVVTTLLADRAPAAVVSYVPPGGPHALPLNGDDYRVDLNGDSYDDFELDGYLGFAIRGLYQPYLGYRSIIQPDLLTYLAALVPAGETIGPEVSSWDSYAKLDSFYGTRGFVGVQFDIPFGSLHFGYLDIAIDRGANFMSLFDDVLTLYGGAYESEANTPITTPVPEPSGLALLAAGAAGLAAWRARRRDRTGCEASV